MGTILLSALIGHSAWHWMTDRGAVLGEYAWELPAWDLSLAIGALRAAMLGLIVIGVGWMMRGLVRRLSTSPAPAATDP
jgi:hypothetical protein